LSNRAFLVEHICNGDKCSEGVIRQFERMLLDSQIPYHKSRQYCQTHKYLTKIRENAVRLTNTLSQFARMLPDSQIPYLNLRECCQTHKYLTTIRENTGRLTNALPQFVWKINGQISWHRCRVWMVVMLEYTIIQNQDRITMILNTNLSTGANIYEFCLQKLEK
jgi:hypothetical protein